MAEPNKRIAENLSDLFIKKYNSDNKASFYFVKQDEIDQDYDFLFKNNDGEELLVQHIEAVPTRGKELSELKKFENHKTKECCPLHLQADELRVEETLGKKLNRHYSTEKKLILLIDFGSFSWDDCNLLKMKKKVIEITEEFNGNFKNVYCIHLGKQKTERLV